MDLDLPGPVLVTKIFLLRGLNVVLKYTISPLKIPGFVLGLFKARFNISFPGIGIISVSVVSKEFVFLVMPRRKVSMEAACGLWPVRTGQSRVLFEFLDKSKLRTCPVTSQSSEM